MKVLFVLGVNQQDRPERWQSRHYIFRNLTDSLRHLGIDSHLYANKLSIKERYLTQKGVSFSDEINLEELLSQHAFTHAFIWGGRSSADKEITAKLVARGIKCIYGESGWFPQSGHCYFSNHGTNSECKLSSEGLKTHKFDRPQFEKVRAKANRITLGFWKSLGIPKLTGSKSFDLTKPILLPLQDETDTNITVASPVKEMHAFVRLIAEAYPDVQFIARAHPRAPAENLPKLPNVTYQDPKQNPFHLWKNYGGVIGINSTTLLQFSLLGVPVCGVGTGIGSGHGAYHDLDIHNLPNRLDEITINFDKSSHFYDFLLRHKQLSCKSLAKPKQVERSYIYSYLKEC